MRRYETIIIIRPNAGEDDIAAMTDRVSTIITDDGGTVIKTDKWGLKKLAYLIKKESQGYYLYIDYAGHPGSVTEIERILKIDDRCIKYMTVKLAKSCDPAALLAEIEEASAATASASAETSEEKNSTPEKPADKTADKPAEAAAETPAEAAAEATGDKAEAPEESA